MKRREIARKFDEIVEFSGVEKFIDTPVKRYSSGMYVRLAFSVAAHLEPEILLVDEVLAVGDAEFQRRCLGRMEELRQRPAAPSSSSPTTCRRSRASATARSCSRAARSRSTGPAGRWWRTTSSTSRGGGVVEVVAGSGLCAGRGPRRGFARCGWSTRRAAARRGRRPPARRHRDHASTSSAAASRSSPRSRCIDSQGDVAFNALDTREQLGRAVAARSVRRDGLDSRQPPHRGPVHRRRRRLLAGRGQAELARPGPRGRRLPRAGPRRGRQRARPVRGQPQRRRSAPARWT